MTALAFLHGLNALLLFGMAFHAARLSAAPQGAPRGGRREPVAVSGG